MFRKLIFAVALALGIGGGTVAIAPSGAQAAVVHPATSDALIKAIEQGRPAAATEVQYRRRYGYRGGGGYRRGYGYRGGYGYRRGYGYRGYGYRRYGYRGYGYGYRRPYYGGYYGGYARCRWVNRRIYNGYRWVWVRRRACW